MPRRPYCDQCENPVPPGCQHFYGDQDNCPLGPRTDLMWRIGRRIWANLTDRGGIKHELEACDDDVRIEIIETMGELAMDEAGIKAPEEEAP